VEGLDGRGKRLLVACNWPKTASRIIEPIMTTALLEQPIFFGNALTPQALSTRIRSLLHFLKLPTSSIMTDMTRCRGRIRIHPFLSLPTNLTRSESLSFRSVNTHSDFTLLRPNQLRYRSRRPTSTFRGKISTQVCLYVTVLCSCWTNVDVSVAGVLWGCGPSSMVNSEKTGDQVTLGGIILLLAKGQSQLVNKIQHQRNALHFSKL